MYTYIYIYGTNGLCICNLSEEKHIKSGHAIPISHLHTQEKTKDKEYSSTAYLMQNQSVKHTKPYWVIERERDQSTGLRMNIHTY